MSLANYLYGWEITHINKPNRLDSSSRILEVGNANGAIVNWRHSLQEAVRNIQAGQRYYVTRGGAQVDVEVVSGGLIGEPFLRTRPDHTGVNNLLHLPPLPLLPPSLKAGFFF